MLQIYTSGSEINKQAKKVILEDLNIYQFLIVNLHYHLLDHKNIDTDWSGTFDIVGLIDTASLIVNQYFKEQDTTTLTKNIEEANIKLIGISNHFNELIDNNSTIKRLGINRYKLSMYLFNGINNSLKPGLSISVSDSIKVLDFITNDDTTLFHISVKYFTEEDSTDNV